MKKLIAIDLDGTTLTSDITITNTTKKTLKRAESCGHVVCIVTGRPNRIAEHIYDELELTSPMINFNGALGYIPHQTWQGEYQRTINKEIVLDILAHKSQLGIQVLAAESKTQVLADRDEAVFQDFFPTNLAANQWLTAKNLTSNPACISMYVDADKRYQIKQQLINAYGDQISVNVWGGPNPILEVAPKGVNKAWAVQYLAQKLNITQDNIVAFGDEHNDLEMLKHAGWGVAMKNATPHLKKAADDITLDDNDHDGLAKYLQKYLNLSA